MDWNDKQTQSRYAEDAARLAATVDNAEAIKGDVTDEIRKHLH